MVVPVTHRRARITILSIKGELSFLTLYRILERQIRMPSVTWVGAMWPIPWRKRRTLFRSQASEAPKGLKRSTHEEAATAGEVSRGARVIYRCLASQVGVLLSSQCLSSLNFLAQIATMVFYKPLALKTDWNEKKGNAGNVFQIAISKCQRETHESIHLPPFAFDFAVYHISFYNSVVTLPHICTSLI